MRMDFVKIASVLLALSPILGVYSVGGTSLSYGDLAMVIICMITIVKGFRKKLRIDRPYFILYFAVMFLPAIIGLIRFGYTDPGEFVGKWLRIITCFFIIDISSKNVMDLDVLEVWCIRAGVVASILLMIQVVAANFFSKPIFFYIDSVPLAGKIYAASYVKHYISMVNQGAGRYSSIFLEPGQFSLYTVLPLIIVLFSERSNYTKRRRLIYGIVMTAGILLSTSGGGIFNVIMIWGIYYYKLVRKKGKAINKAIVLTAFAIGAVLFLTRTNFIDLMMSRVEIKENRGMHLFQGLVIFDALPPFEKMFGLGYGNVVQYLWKYNITTQYHPSGVVEGMNAFSLVLNSSGIIGLPLFLCILGRMLFKNKSTSCRIVILVVSIAMGTSGLFTEPTGVLYLTYARRAENMTTYQHLSKSMEDARERITDAHMENF